jgi:hypothetical protein
VVGRYVGEEALVVVRLPRRVLRSRLGARLLPEGSRTGRPDGSTATARRGRLSHLTSLPHQPGRSEHPMGLFDHAKDLLGKAEELAGEHADQVKAGLDKAEDAVNKATGGKYSGAIGSAGDKAAAYVEGLHDKKD